MIKKIILLIAVVSTFIYAKEVKNIEFNVTTIDGKTIKIIGKKDGIEVPSAKGKIIFAEFWGVGCPPCRASIPFYNDLAKKYSDKLEILAFEAQDTPKKFLLKFAKDNKIVYNVFEFRENIDFIRYLGKRAGWRGAIPYLVIFDTKGEVVDIHRGMASKEYLEKVIEIIWNRDHKIKSQNKQNVNKKPENNTTK